MGTKGKLIVVSAPSGAGKTTLSRMAVNRIGNLKFSISYTTRAPRGEEVNGVDYRFVDKDEFQRMAANGDFLEHAKVHDNYYGTAKKDLEDLKEDGVNVILDIDVQGAAQLRKANVTDAVFVFIVPPSPEECRKRLLGRGFDSEEVIESRVKASISEIKEASMYDYIIINDDLEAAFGAFKAILEGSGSDFATKALIGRIKDIFSI